MISIVHVPGSGTAGSAADSKYKNARSWTHGGLRSSLSNIGSGSVVVCVFQWPQRHRATTAPAARPMAGRRKWVLSLSRCSCLSGFRQPELTIPALVAELAALKVAINPVTIWRLIRWRQ